MTMKVWKDVMNQATPTDQKNSLAIFPALLEGHVHTWFNWKF